MTSQEWANAGVDASPVRVGAMLYTLVDPEVGFERAYNRWYERDHQFGGCMVGAGWFSNRRWVATAGLKALRFPADNATVASPATAGSYLAVYWVDQSQLAEALGWSPNLSHQVVRLSTDPRTKAYAAKLTAAGKSKKDILRCLKRAIAREAWHLLVHPAPAPRIDDLRPLRHLRGLTLTQAAEHLGTVPARISELEPTAGNVAKDVHERMAYLRQDQFAFEQQRVIDVVMMGHEEMWACMLEKDAIYANPEATEEDYLHAADLEARYAEYGGYTAEARAGELLLGVGIPAEQHFGPMSDVAPGWKLRVLLIQALFADPEILLLDEPTNNLDIATIRWLENVLNDRNSTMIIISHDRHFLNQVCTHMADLDYGKITVYPGNYDDFMEASSQARQQQQNANARAKERISELQDFVRRFSANKSKAKQATSRVKLIE